MDGCGCTSAEIQNYFNLRYAFRGIQVILIKFKLICFLNMDNNQFSFKKGGKQLPGQSGQANIFAMAASTSQR